MTLDFGQHGFCCGLVVKGKSRYDAERTIVRKLNEWFLSDKDNVPPFRDGSLLLFTVHDSPFGFFTTAELQTMLEALSQYQDKTRSVIAWQLAQRIKHELESQPRHRDTAVE